MMLAAPTLSEVEVLHDAVERLGESLREVQGLVHDLPSVSYLDKLIEKLETAAQAAKSIAG